ncbi:MAG: hypothetical protein NVSMB9_03530 [Isosphaeraceae bacterium]
MVPPADPILPRRGATWALAGFLASLALLLCPGCGLVPRARLDDCHRLSQTLRAENNRLKDVSLDLRAQNQDLTQRAVDDSKRLAVQEEAVQRLERSVLAYQSEREALASAFEAVKRQVRTAVVPHPAARSARLKSFVQAHPGWSFDEPSLTVSAASDRLFEPGTDRLRTESKATLEALASELSGAGVEDLTLVVVGPANQPALAQAGFETRGSGFQKGQGVIPSSSRFLSTARAARVRERLVSDSGLNPERVRLAPPPRDLTPNDPAKAVQRQIEIRLLPDPSRSLVTAAPSGEDLQVQLNRSSAGKGEGKRGPDSP